MTKGKEPFLLVLFTLHVKSHQSVWGSGAPAKCPLRLPQMLQVPHPETSQAEAAAELWDLTNCMDYFLIARTTKDSTYEVNTGIQQAKSFYLLNC